MQLLSERFAGLVKRLCRAICVLMSSVGRRSDFLKIAHFSAVMTEVAHEYAGQFIAMFVALQHDLGTGFFPLLALLLLVATWPLMFATLRAMLREWIRNEWRSAAECIFRLATLELSFSVAIRHQGEIPPWLLVVGSLFSVCQFALRAEAHDSKRGEFQTVSQTANVDGFLKN